MALALAQRWRARGVATGMAYINIRKRALKIFGNGMISGKNEKLYMSLCVCSLSSLLYSLKTYNGMVLWRFPHGYL